MKECWIAFEESMPLELKKALLQTIQGFCRVVISNADDAQIIRSYGMLLASKENGDVRVIDETEIDKVEVLPKPLCLRLVVKDRTDEIKAIKAAGKGVDYLVINCPDWKVIPLENLIAKTRGDTQLFAEVSSSEEARIALETLELGVDGVVLSTSDGSEIAKIMKDLASYELIDPNKRAIPLSLGTVTRISQLSMGARVCIDTCDLMIPGEGMLVGCGSSGLFLVQAEVHENPHVEPRPFRVNAGPVSLYILVSADDTRYLTELVTGDEVLMVNREGLCRKAMVGRIKIERRPLTLVEAEVNGDVVKTIVQNAETIRFVTKKDSISVTELKQGDQILVFHQRGGRHFGALVEEETIVEK
ncbi:MAG: 3-dehydroquinate synthase II [Candidatus Bathyarchaeota archaeon]|nr:MAG: 3-dehydroquinate synthase II [Candidatus Bathyarchaeota archaeon]